MTTNTTPEVESHPLHITREVPLWGLISVLGALAGQAIGLYYSNAALSAQVASQGKKLEEVAGDIRSLNTELNARAVRDATTLYRVDDLARRLTAVELLQTTRTTK